ncbi:TPA: hypothetical protein ACVO5A_001131 [Legionella pneumophila]
MQVLQERRLRLSGKKTRIGSIDRGFHFLGIQYPKTQPLDNTTMTRAVVTVSNTERVGQNQAKSGGGRDYLTTRRAASFANTQCSSCKNIAQSARAS